MKKYIYLIEDIEGTLGVFESMEKLKNELSKYDENDDVFEHHSEVSRWTLNSMDSEYIARTKDVNEDNIDEFMEGIVMKPTQKQLEFIKIIEDEWNAAKFTGTTKQEATAYICFAVHEMNEMNRNFKRRCWR